MSAAAQRSSGRAPQVLCASSTHSPTVSTRRGQPRSPRSQSPHGVQNTPTCLTPGEKRRKQKSLEHLPLPTRFQPTFILSPLEAMPVSPTSVLTHSDVPVDERPRRAASSPQLVRARARSDSASSSASLTATEDNYARARTYEGASASASRFPTAYPPLWALAQPVSLAGADSEAVSGPSDASDSEDDRDYEADDLIFVSRASSSTSVSSGLRNRRSAQRRKEPEVCRVVTTARGQPCAGETETELDELPQRLPTSRNIVSRPVVPLLIDFLVPFMFQVTRFLSIIPATFGTLYNIYHVVYPPPTSDVKLSSIDFVVCALWAILTGFQCLFLTTGLLLRWKAYYTTPSTLVRLVALQCICWPATHFTLVFFDHTRRPVACWVLIGTTTCLSRSVQLWVTSNLFMPVNGGRGRGEGNLNWKVLREGRLGPRRWDWAEVIVKCGLPAGVLYFITAWALILKGEVEHRG